MRSWTILQEGARQFGSKVREGLCCLLLAALLTTLLPGHAQAEALRVVAGTSLIEDIVRDLTDGKSQILTLVQGSSCPGQDHSKTRDFVHAAGADLVLIHAFQRRMPQLVDMLTAVGKGSAPLVVLEERGSWLVPENQQKAVRSIAAALKQAAPSQADAVEARAQSRLARVDAVAQECRQALAPVRGKKVIAAEMQKEFAAWAGLEVARSYGRVEDISAKALVDILQGLRDVRISGVIDNAQSGPDAGLPLALELKTPHVTLSNFPGSDPAVPDYFSLLRANTRKLAEL